MKSPLFSEVLQKLGWKVIKQAVVDFQPLFYCREAFFQANSG